MNQKLLAICTLAMAGATTFAQWTVVNLHPASSTRSEVNSGAATMQAGSARFAGVTEAGFWNGTAGSWTSLHPATATASRADAISATQQAGYVTIGGIIRASLWSGTAASRVDLQPTFLTSSQVLGIAGNQQVGSCTFNGRDRACLWTGSAASWVNLDVISTTTSIAWATDGVHQVGSIDSLAALWSGTAASVVSLHPAGATTSSARAVSGSQQAGTVSFGFDFKASIWTGTAASWVSLHPALATQSEVLSTNGTYQAGYVQFGSTKKASVWTGTAASWEDLSLALTGSWGESEARTISSDGNFLYVAGFARNNLTARNEAVLWRRPLGVMVSGRITFQDFVGAAPNSASLEVRRVNDSSLVSTPTVTLDSQGNFAGLSLPSGGPYYATHKSGTWLRGRGAIDPGTGELFISMINGDSVDDNIVDLSDYTAVIVAFNALPASGNWNPRADLNGDGVVDLTDYTIVATNFNRLGN